MTEEHIPIEISNRLLRKLRENEDNSHCIDCLASMVEFASIAHGTFLCSLCAISHERLGLSSIKPLSSLWKLPELRIMTAGGNSAFRDFFNIYNLAEAPMDFKYRTKAAYFYREVLIRLANGDNFEGNYPSLEEGLETFEELDLEDIDSTTESIEDKSKWRWITNLYKKYPDLSRKSFEVMDKSVKKIKKLANVDGILLTAKKSLEEFSVDKVKIEAKKIINDLERYLSASGSYFSIINSCSNPEP